MVRGEAAGNGAFQGLSNVELYLNGRCTGRLRRSGAPFAEAVSSEEEMPAPRVFRIAHLTDFHVQPERGGAEGMAAALRHVNALEDRPDLLLTGGDLVMNAFGVPLERAETEWALFEEVLERENALPVEHCVGNHDVRGWDDDRDGKAWILGKLGLERSYRSFDTAGWHIVILDSVHPGPGREGYVARLDEEQVEWLERDLAQTPPSTPVLVASHIPILSVTPFIHGEHAQDDVWAVPAAWMHLDAKRIRSLFARHPNVRVCISGHMHLVDQCDYNGVTYFCNGAVCGAWWNGRFEDSDPAYALLDLFEDGSFARTVVHYG